jgi:hypothetical protein
MRFLNGVKDVYQKPGFLKLHKPNVWFGKLGLLSGRQGNKPIVHHIEQ